MQCNSCLTYRSVLLSPFQPADNPPAFFSLREATPNQSGEAIYEEVPGCEADVDYESNYILTLDCIPSIKREDGKYSGWSLH